VNRDLPKPIKDHNGGNYPLPSQVQIADRQMAPNFTNPVREYQIKSSLSGEVTARVFHSQDNTVEYTIATDASGHSWFLSVRPAQALINGNGIPSRFISDLRPLLIPRWEHSRLVPQGYSGSANQNKPDYIDAWRYIREIPEMQRYYREVLRRPIP
jgi:hypothetical protein